MPEVWQPDRCRQPRGKGKGGEPGGSGPNRKHPSHEGKQQDDNHTKTTRTPATKQTRHTPAASKLWKFETLWEHPLGRGEATCHSSWLYTAGETSDFRHMHRAQTSSSYHLYIGTAERCYHLDRRCRCYPDWDNVKRGLTICEICRISSSTFEIGQCIFVSEQGQKFHLTRFCRTFKSLPVTEYARCTPCCLVFGSKVRAVLHRDWGH